MCINPQQDRWLTISPSHYYYKYVTIHDSMHHFSSVYISLSTQHQNIYTYTYIWKGDTFFIYIIIYIDIWHIWCQHGRTWSLYIINQRLVPPPPWSFLGSSSPRNNHPPKHHLSPPPTALPHTPLNTSATIAIVSLTTRKL